MVTSAKPFGSKTTDSIDVDAPAAVVWSVYTDIAAWPTWTASVRSASMRPAGPVSLGAQATIKQPRLPTVTWTVDQLEQGTSWRWTSRLPGATTVASHHVSETGDARARVDLWIDQRGIIGRLVGWLVRRLTRRYLRLEAEGLKRQSEALWQASIIAPITTSPRGSIG